MTFSPTADVFGPDTLGRTTEQPSGQRAPPFRGESAAMFTTDTSASPRPSALDGLRRDLEQAPPRGPRTPYLAAGAATTAAVLTAVVTGSAWQSAAIAAALLLAVVVAAVLI